MARIDSAFERLKVVGFLQPLRDITIRGGNLSPFETGWFGLQLGRSHVRPDDLRLLDARVRLELDALAHAPVAAFGRKIDALAGDVVLPTVVHAAKPTFLVPGKPQRNAAMRAELVEQADAALGVAECDERLAQQLHAHRRAIRLGQLPAMPRRYPIAAEKIAHQGTGAGLRERVVFFP